MAHEYLPKRLGCSESLLQYWGGSHRWGGQRGHPHYPLPSLSPAPPPPPNPLLAPIIYLSTSALNYRQWSGGQGAGLSDLGLVWLMNNGVRPPSCLFPAFTQSGGPGRTGGTRLLNYNQHFVVLIRLACSHSPAVTMNMDGETRGRERGVSLRGRHDGGVSQAGFPPRRETQADGSAVNQLPHRSAGKFQLCRNDASLSRGGGSIYSRASWN